MLQARIDTDVLVAGGGLAGVAAAVAAGRAGAKTVLVEGSGTLGGTATAGLNCSFQGVDTELMGGICREIVEELVARSGAIHGVYTPFSVEALKDICFDLLESAGVQLQFHLMADDVVMDGRRVTGIVFKHKGGRELIRARTIVDTTGDGDIAALAGAEFELGDPSSGEIQPVTMLFRMGNVNVDETIDYVEATPDQFYKEKLLFVCDRSKDPPLVIANGFFDWVRQQREKGLYLGREAIAVINTPNPNEVLINATRTAEINALNAFELTRAIIDTRRQVRTLVRCLKESMPGFQNAYLIDTAAQLGVRETRRIVGLYQLNEDDIAAGRMFEDRIARNFFPIDIHGPRSNPHGYTWIVPQGDGFYSIPYRSLVPKSVDGLLMGGRCISTTHVAFGSTRSMPCCIATGQAAGVAAALASEHGSNPREVVHGRVQEVLKGQGVPL